MKQPRHPLNSIRSQYIIDLVCLKIDKLIVECSKKSKEEIEEELICIQKNCENVEAKISEINNVIACEM